MNRRDFIKNSTAAFFAASSLLSLGSTAGNLFASNRPFSPSAFDLVAVKNGEPDVMFDKAIEALGGIGKFVKKGQKVVVKPNIGWDVEPEKAANTNPKLVKRIIERCLQAGAKEVYVFDNTCDNWTRCYKNSGIEKAVKEAGGKLVPGNTESYYQQVTVKGASKLKTAKVHELILESDVFINVPVLKHHSSGRLTISMKNLMGIVWDRGFWHSNDLHQCIAEFPLWKKPTLNVVDAYNVMMQNGPRGVSVNDVVSMKSLIISADIVAADAAAAKLFGKEPADIPYIKRANDLKLGRMNLDSLSIERIKL